ncbi:proline--tRNA ligase [Gammaproteobacteria bacterium]|nr:proline--tRNA ligase [SAR86 cluster bacterium]MDC0577398.1 proline--tRNA ligase [Gammaproteobacteria bacterium]|tara:strand:- start:6322 stop:7596 length:1275 start_codon:yes stop_codon:yes gene_type:complete
MKASKLILGTQRENPADAEIVSHQLMIRAGLIRQVSSGIYNWLPLGKKVLQKVEDIIRTEMNNSDAQEILMPMVQPAALWEESGRIDQYGQELLVFLDRHDNKFCLGPTHEEIITDLCKNLLTSYKQLPVTLYQIQTKFRDEIRPRFGVMRSREFIMKDAYSFDLNKEGLDQSYAIMKGAYINIFNRLGLDYRIVKADSGAIGGSDSEEFHVLADSGEDLLAFSDKSDYAINAELLTELQEGQDPYSLEGKQSPDGKGNLKLKKGIEVGHIFKLGKKYSEILNLRIQGEDGDINPEMGCYGIGASRIVAAAIEQNHDEKGIVWPKSLSPFQVALVEVNSKDNKVVKDKCNEIYQLLKDNNIETLWDDRDKRPGVKFSDMEVIGIPMTIIVGERTLETGQIEIKKRKDEKPELVSHQDLLSLILS